MRFLHYLDMWFLLVDEKGNRELTTGQYIEHFMSKMCNPHIYDVTEIGKVEELQVKDVNGGKRVYRQDGELLFGVCP